MNLMLLVVSLLFNLAAAKLTITAVSQKKLNFGYISNWDARTQSLYVTDPSKSLVRYDAISEQLYEGKFANPDIQFDFFLPTSECINCFVASAGREVYIFNWDGYNSNATLIRNITTLPGETGYTYANTAKTDPRSRLLIATWRYDRCNPNGNSPNGSVDLIQRGNVETILEDAQYPSGLEWNILISKMYYIDICRLNIRAYDWSPRDGTVANPSVVYNFRDDFPFQSTIAPYLPVGMSINCDGNLMIGMFNLTAVVEINPTTGKLVRTIKIPAETVTGAVYGGKHLDKLFVTTTVRKSNFYGQSEPDSKNPDSGKIFMIEGLGSQGCTGRPAKNVYNHNIEIESEFFQMLN